MIASNRARQAVINNIKTIRSSHRNLHGLRLLRLPPRLNHTGGIASGAPSSPTWVPPGKRELANRKHCTYGFSSRSSRRTGKLENAPLWVISLTSLCDLHHWLL